CDPPLPGAAVPSHPRQPHHPPAQQRRAGAARRDQQQGAGEPLRDPPGEGLRARGSRSGGPLRAVVRAHAAATRAREDLEVAAFSGLSSGYRLRNLALARSRGQIVVLMSGLGGLSTIVVLWYGGGHVIAGTLTL